jgi:hypothetical protein
VKRHRLENGLCEVDDDSCPSKFRKVVREASHTLRGLTDGCLRVSANIHKSPCLVIGDSFLSWLIHVPEFGFQVDQIIVKSPRHVAIFHRICGDDVPVWCGTDLGILISALAFREDLKVCFLDGRVTSGLLDALAGRGIVDVLSTQTPRRACRGWQSAFVNVPHSDVGGVTTRVVTLVRHSKGSVAGLPSPLALTAKRDAATVLSHATFGRYFRPRPENTLVEPLRCQNLGTVSHPYYHGYGWLPAILSRRVRVLTPVLNSVSHSGQWCSMRNSRVRRANQN